MTYREIDHGNYTKIFDSSQYSDLPDSVDWRTSNAVTDIKNQVNCLLYTEVKLYRETDSSNNKNFMAIFDTYKHLHLPAVFVDTISEYIYTKMSDLSVAKLS